MLGRWLIPAWIALIAVAAASAAAAQPPLGLALAWDGAPCNADGAVAVTVTNRGAAPLALPRVAGLGVGSLFIARVASHGRVTGSIGHGFQVPYPPEAFRTPVVLARGDARVYRLDLFNDRDTLDAFSPGYAEMIRDGGRLNVVYALHLGPADADPRFYFVGHGLTPLIDSNTLVCPPPASDALGR